MDLVVNLEIKFQALKIVPERGEQIGQLILVGRLLTQEILTLKVKHTPIEL